MLQSDNLIHLLLFNERDQTCLLNLLNIYSDPCYVCRRVSNSSSASSDSSSSEASHDRVHPYQNIPEPDQQPIRGQYSGHVTYPDQSEGGGSLSSVHEYDYPQVEKHQRLPLRGPQRQNEYYPEVRITVEYIHVTYVPCM